jgi:putative ABC transport system permease protein
MLRKNPGFTFVAVLTLALGIGATSALFRMVEAVLLKPLPYQETSRLAVLWTDNVRQNLHEERTSYPNFEDWQKQNSTFEDMAFASAFTVNLTVGEEPERLVAGRTSANLFSLLGVKPILGRTFSNEEEKRGERVIVMGFGYARLVHLTTLLARVSRLTERRWPLSALCQRRSSSPPGPSTCGSR